MYSCSPGTTPGKEPCRLSRSRESSRRNRGCGEGNQRKSSGGAEAGESCSTRDKTQKPGTVAIRTSELQAILHHVLMHIFAGVFERQERGIEGFILVHALMELLSDQHVSMKKYACPSSKPALGLHSACVDTRAYTHSRVRICNRQVRDTRPMLTARALHANSACALCSKLMQSLTSPAGCT